MWYLVKHRDKFPFPLHNLKHKIKISPVLLSLRSVSVFNDTSELHGLHNVEKKDE
jgi:hypothetical protein